MSLPGDELNNLLNPEFATTPEAADAELREAAAAIAMEIAPETPPARTRGRVLAAIAREPRVAAASAEEGWSATGQQGISIKLLYHDAATGMRTQLIRMAPGAVFPAHFHPEAEQCYVVQGDVRWHNLLYRAGDFVVAPKGTVHPSLTTEEGNILLMISGRNELRHEYEA